MRCHYEVLGVERDANEDDLKKAYRKRALQFHPDKNPGREEECQQQFILVQQAYEILSDPKERSWYDEHREKILHGDDYDGTGVDLMPYFCPSVFSGYGDNDDGFYSVYRKVFETIAEEDSEYVDSEEMPSFGDSKTAYKPEVDYFYDMWQSYCTPKTFVWVEKYDTREAPNRRVLRLMEKENKKLRDAAKKARNEEVRALVAFVKKRDKRVKVYREEMKLKEEERKILTQQKRSKEKRKRVKELQDFEEQEWASMNTLEEEMKQMELHLDSEFGTNSDLDDEQSDEEIVEDNYCIACDKYFKTEKALKNHEKSKKHKENVTYLKNEMGKDLFDDSDVSDIDGVAEDDLTCTDVCIENEDDIVSETSGNDDNIEIEVGENEDENNLEMVSNMKPSSSNPSPSPSGDKTSMPINEGLSESVGMMEELQQDSIEHTNKDFSSRDDKLENCDVPNGDILEEFANIVPDSTLKTSSNTCEHSCIVCKASFETRNVLFKHIKKEGHAALKGVDNKNTTNTKKKGKNSKKKR